MGSSIFLRSMRIDREGGVLVRRVVAVIAFLAVVAISFTGIALADETDAASPHNKRTQLFGDWGGIRPAAMTSTRTNRKSKG